MTRVLIVMTDDVRRETLAVLTGDEGMEVLSTSSGLQALTQLERNTPDIIICDDLMSDLSAMEFHEIIRSEPETRETTLLLVTDAPPLWLDPKYDVCIPSGYSSRDLVMRLVEKTTRLAKDPFRLQSLDPAPTNAQMRGTLEVVNLFDLIVSFNQMLKTGRIIVNVGDTEAMIYLLRGEVWHVEYGNISGKRALLTAFADSDRAPTSSFAFDVVTEALVERLPQTVRMFTSRLLLEIAVHLDHVRSAIQSAPSPRKR